MSVLKILTLGSFLLVGSAYGQYYGGYNNQRDGGYNNQRDGGYRQDGGPRQGQYNVQIYQNANDNDNDDFKDGPNSDNPLCSAISSQSRVELIVQTAKKVSDKEVNVVFKRLVIEPYAFGFAGDKRPVLRGNVISDNILKDITIKYGEGEAVNDKEFQWTNDEDNQKKGFFSGWGSSDKGYSGKNIDIQNISDVRIVKNTHFVVPKDYKPVVDDNIRIICQVPSSNPNDKNTNTK